MPPFSKRWLLEASNPAFLRRFRSRHAPQLLGFFASMYRHYEFVSLPQPPELAALSSQVSSSCAAAAFSLLGAQIRHCRNGRLISGIFKGGGFKYSLLAPLLAGDSVAIHPPARMQSIYQPSNMIFSEIFLPEDGIRDGITFVRLWKVARKVYAEMSVLGPDG